MLTVNAALRSLQVEDCLLQDTDYFKGDDLEKIPGVANTESCHQACLSNLGCKYFTYIGSTHSWIEGRGTCILKGDNAPKTTVTSIGADSGPKSCGCFKTGFDAWGGDLKMIPKVDSAVECQNLCQRNSKCEGFSWLSTNAAWSAGRLNCYLKKSTGNLSPKIGIVSGERVCKDDGSSVTKKPTSKPTEKPTNKPTASSPDDSCFSIDQDYPGNDLQKILGVSTKYKCFDFCTQDEACLAFAWISPSSPWIAGRYTCFLKGSGGTLKPSNGAIAGLRNCTVRTPNPTINEGYKLVWSDEFEGSTIDTSKWGYDILPPYKYNNELQSYTNSAENSFVENGMLHIRAVKQGNGYTSARMVTKGKGDWLYGKIIVRAKLPVGQGLWPAIWALPTSSPYRWPKAGEIDIMEHVSCDVNQVHGTVHTGAYNWPMKTQKGSGAKVAVSKFHDYILEWDANQLSVSVDKNRYFTFKNDHTGNIDTWPFKNKFHLILNIAVGGDWGGYCLNGAKPNFPSDEANSHMVVDFVRVYSK